MSTAQETLVPTREARPGPPPRNGRWSGYRHLLLARLLELKREPEVVFWVFVFPLLLALGLGIAFRNKPGDVASVAVVAEADLPGVRSYVPEAVLARALQSNRFGP